MKGASVGSVLPRHLSKVQSYKIPVLNGRDLVEISGVGRDLVPAAEIFSCTFRRSILPDRLRAFAAEDDRMKAGWENDD